MATIAGTRTNFGSRPMNTSSRAPLHQRHVAHFLCAIGMSNCAIYVPFIKPRRRSTKYGAPCGGSSEATGMPGRETHTRDAVKTASSRVTPSCPNDYQSFRRTALRQSSAHLPSLGKRILPPAKVEQPHIPARHPTVIIYAIGGEALCGKSKKSCGAGARHVEAARTMNLQRIKQY